MAVEAGSRSRQSGKAGLPEVLVESEGAGEFFVPHEAE
jgi:hypothetical protein